MTKKLSSEENGLDQSWSPEIIRKEEKKQEAGWITNPQSLINIRQQSVFIADFTNVLERMFSEITGTETANSWLGSAVEEKG